MAYNITWMDNATTISDALVGGLTTTTTGSTLGVESIGFLLLFGLSILVMVRLNGQLQNLGKAMVISSFIFLMIGVFFSAIGIYGIYWNALFLAELVGGILVIAFKGG